MRKDFISRRKNNLFVFANALIRAGGKTLKGYCYPMFDELLQFASIYLAFNHGHGSEYLCCLTRNMYTWKFGHICKSAQLLKQIKSYIASSLFQMTSWGHVFAEWGSYFRYGIVIWRRSLTRKHTCLLMEAFQWHWRKSKWISDICNHISN